MAYSFNKKRYLKENHKIPNLSPISCMSVKDYNFPFDMDFEKFFAASPNFGCLVLLAEAVPIAGAVKLRAGFRNSSHASDVEL